MRELKALTVGALLLVMAIVAGLVIVNRRSDVAVADEVPIAHVHGLGLNPADGSLIIATHTGSFRLPEGSSKPSRIGSSYQDTMGFTVAGPNHFIGSGHPDVPGRLNGQPSLLGLIESASAGLTWTVRSLSGEADFHGLVIADGQTYGWDSTSGKLMVSTDLVSWETRSTVDLLAFVVEPSDASRLIGASPAGLIQSSDGGRTWKQLAGPALQVLSWTKGSVLDGVDQSGTVWQRVAGEWQQQGRLPGEPEALTSADGVLYAAAHDAKRKTGIYQSRDDGRTWRMSPAEWWAFGGPPSGEPSA